MGDKTFTELEMEYFKDLGNDKIQDLLNKLCGGDWNKFQSNIDVLDELQKADNLDMVYSFFKDMVECDDFLDMPLLQICESNNEDIGGTLYVFVFEQFGDDYYKLATYADEGFNYEISPQSLYSDAKPLDIYTMREFIDLSRPHDPLGIMDFSIVDVIKRQ